MSGLTATYRRRERSICCSGTLRSVQLRQGPVRTRPAPNPPDSQPQPPHASESPPLPVKPEVGWQEVPLGPSVY